MRVSRFVFRLALPLALAVPPAFAAAPEAPTANAASVAWDDLLLRAIHEGSSPERKAAKASARAELFARGGDTVRYLMIRAHEENVAVNSLCQEISRALPATSSVPALVPYLEDTNALTRKSAAWLLGFHQAPEEWRKVFPLLGDDKARSAAIRTLGKWRIREAGPAIGGHLASTNERARVAAANALRDIGDPRGIPPLVAALGDPVFTVRNTAVRALVSFGSAAVPALLDALPAAGPPAQRQLVRALGELRAVPAVPALRRLADAPDPELARDAQDALAAMSAPTSPAAP